MGMWLDTEFNGFCGELLSIALIAEDGSYFYKVFDFSKLELDDWVLQNVISNIFLSPDTETVDRSLCQPKFDIQLQLSVFLNKYDTVEIIADWPDDIGYLCELMIISPGRCILTPSQIKFTIDRELGSISRVPHHAYYDALANMEMTLTKELERNHGKV